MIGWSVHALGRLGVVVLLFRYAKPVKASSWRLLAAIVLGRWRRHHVSCVGALSCEKHRSPASGRHEDLPRSAWRSGRRCHLSQRRAF